ncbi:hypothetical protein ABIA33_000732 [Streptacidiphilus sp. MAP12-16]|uniref:hypothetical protein n=1 Tax=Streptacidiphilus sp. MAP12-16 TaxID=3156300 RepID=UPI0035159FF4
MIDASSARTTLQVCGKQPAGRACTLTISDVADQPWVTATPSAPTAPPATARAATPPTPTAPAHTP